MKINKFAVLIGAFAFLCAGSAVSFADSSEDVTPASRKIYLEPQKTMLEKGTFKFILALTGGYDNNAHLDSTRNGDPFGQTFFRASFVTPLSQKTNAIFDYEMMNLIYAGESDLDITKNGIRAGIDHKLNDKLTFSAGYSFDSIVYLYRKDEGPKEDYLDNALEFKLRQKLSDKVYHSVNYDVLYRSYLDRYTRTGGGVSTDKERIDVRNVFGYEIGKYFSKDLVKLGAEYYDNNSNESYLKYYDYDSYKLSASLTHLFNKTWSGYTAYSWQCRDYNGRTLIGDATKTELEQTSVATAALFYTFSKSLSFGLNYTYRQNSSNEPIDKYSGSIISVSTYYKF